MNKIFYLSMITLFPITYHIIKTTTEKQNMYDIVTISCNDHNALDEFYKKYFSKISINKFDQIFLNTQSFETHFKQCQTNSNFCYSLYLIALIQNDTCIGFAEYKKDFINIGHNKGQYFYNPSNPSKKDYEFGFIEFLYINPQYRKQGFGTILMSHLMKALHSTHAYLIVTSSNAQAINFYNKLGFTKINIQQKTMFTPNKGVQKKIKTKEYLILEKTLP